MKILESTIQELYQMEPFWNICNPCQCHGHCCIGADVTIYESDWVEIARYIQALPYEDQDTLRFNIKRKRKCVFRANDKCLIHPVRPENCRFTPYQYLVTDDGNLRYTQVKRSNLTGTCKFRSVDRKLDAATAHDLRQCKFATLDNLGRPTVYLSLNWLASHSQTSGEAHLASEWIRMKSL